MLATEALAAAGSAAVASAYAIGHARRLLTRDEGTARLRVAVALFAAFSMFAAADELYWGVARWMGMPAFLVNGFAPLSLKIVNMYVLSGGVIWLYAQRWPLVKAVGIPTGLWVASCFLTDWWLG